MKEYRVVILKGTDLAMSAALNAAAAEGFALDRVTSPAVAMLETPGGYVEDRYERLAIMVREKPAQAPGAEG